MAGYCFRYKNKMVSHISGMGNTEYVFSVRRNKDVDPKTGVCLKGINFGYNTDKDKGKAITKLKNYIDKHYTELYECNSDCPGFNTCKNVEEIK